MFTYAFMYIYVHAYTHAHTQTLTNPYITCIHTRDHKCELTNFGADLCLHTTESNVTVVTEV